jgi:hypothetical protein
LRNESLRILWPNFELIVPIVDYTILGIPLRDGVVNGLPSAKRINEYKRMPPARIRLSALYPLTGFRFPPPATIMTIANARRSYACRPGVLAENRQ